MANSNCVFKKMDCLGKKYPYLSQKERLEIAHPACESSKDIFDFVEDSIGSNKMKELLIYRKMKGIWEEIRELDAPILEDTKNKKEYPGKLYLKKVKADFVVINDLNQALTPVASSVVMARAVKDDKLYVRFHSSPENTYKYSFGSNEGALRAFNELVKESPGRWVWKNLRGHEKGEPTLSKPKGQTRAQILGSGKYGRTVGTGKVTSGGGRTEGRQTIGGKGSNPDQKHNYEKIGKVIAGIETVPNMEKLAKEMRTFKMGVKAEIEGATSGEPFAIEELRRFQERIFKEKEGRKGIHEEVSRMIKELRTKKLSPRGRVEAKEPSRERKVNPFAKLKARAKVKKKGAKKKQGAPSRYSRAKAAAKTERYKRGTSSSDFEYVGNVNDLVEDTALDDCTAKGHTKEECFKFFAIAKKKEKASRPAKHRKQFLKDNPGSEKFVENFFVPNELLENEFIASNTKEIHPTLNVSRNVNLNRYDWKIDAINDTLINEIPKKLQNLSKTFVYDEITDHPINNDLVGKVPKSYKDIGWDIPYEEITGIHNLKPAESVISAKNGIFVGRTARHEVGHGVWENNLSAQEKVDFEILFDKHLEELREQERDYEANNIHEFFAVNFEKIISKSERLTGFPDVDKYFRRLAKVYDFVNDQEESKKMVKALEITFIEDGLEIYDLRKLEDVPKTVVKKLIEKGLAKVIEVEDEKKQDFTEDTEEGRGITNKLLNRFSWYWDESKREYIIESEDPFEKVIELEENEKLPKIKEKEDFLVEDALVDDISIWIGNLKKKSPKFISKLNKNVQSGRVPSNFWDSWRSNKEAIKKAGLSVSKYQGIWQLSYWSKPVQTKLPKIIRPKKVELKRDVSDKLLKHQREHASKIAGLLKTNGSVLDASDTGTGKTYSSLAVAKQLGLEPVIIAPNAVTSGWKKALNHFGMKKATVVNWALIQRGKIRNKKGKSVKTDLLTIKDKKENDSKFQWNLKSNQVLIFDEAHRAKNFKTNNAQMVIAAGNQKAKTMMLSATIAEDPIKFKAIGRALGLFSGNNGFYSWAKQYGAKTVQITSRIKAFQFKGTEKDLSRLHDDLFGAQAERMRISEIKDFPETQITPETFDLGENSKKIQRAYNQMESQLEALKEHKGEGEKTPLAIIQEARQKIELLKVPSFTEIAKDMVDSGNSVTLFVNYKETANQLAKKLGKDAVLFTGDIKKEEREKNRELFQSDQKRIFIATVPTAKEGIDLHDITGKHPRVSLISPSYSAQEMKQVFGRVQRAGGKSKSIQYMIFTADTIEEKIAQRVGEKLRNIEAFNDGDLVAFTLESEAISKAKEKEIKLPEKEEKILKKQETWQETLRRTTKGFELSGITRSQKSISMDKRIRAKKIASTKEEIKEWRKRPNQSDREGIDTPEKGQAKKFGKKSKKDFIEGFDEYEDMDTRKNPTKIVFDLKGKKVQSLRMGENAESHRSMDTIIEILSWSLGGNIRDERQFWWNEMLEKFPKVKKYIGKTKETDRPEYLSNELLYKIGKFILKKEGKNSIYEDIEYEEYKEFENRKSDEVPVLVMKGINVNPGTEVLELVYEGEQGSIVEGEIIGENTWRDGDVMIDHKILFEFNPQDPKELLEALIRYPDIIGNIWDIDGVIEEYVEKNYDEYENEWYDEPIDEFIDKIEHIKKEKEKSSGKGRGWHGESERHSTAAKKGRKDISDTYEELQHATRKLSVWKAKKEELEDKLMEVMGNEEWNEMEGIETPFEESSAYVRSQIKYATESIEDWEVEVKELTNFTNLGLKRKEITSEKEEPKEIISQEEDKDRQTFLKDRKGQLELSIEKVEEDLKFINDKLSGKLSIHDKLFFRNNKERYEKELQQLEQAHKQVNNELRTTFTSLGLKKKGKGKGKGWHGDPEGHRKAAIKGKKSDFKYVGNIHDLREVKNED